MAAESSRKRNLTVADVAERAGVGKATASRVLGDYGHFSDANRDKVLRAAAELGYRPNELARSMNTGRTKTIGLIIGDIENNYFSRATRGVSDAVRAAGYDLLLINTSEQLSEEQEAVRVLLDKRVDAIIASPVSAFHFEHLQQIITAGRPLVLLDRAVEGLKAPVVQSESTSAAHELTTLLIEAGHRRIGFLSALDPGTPSFQGFPLAVSSVSQRITGMIRAHAAEGVPVDHELFRFNASDAASTSLIVGQLLQQSDPPTALIASDSNIVLDIFAALRERGLTAPHDISLAAFDDPPWTAFTSPPLCVVAQPTYELGREAALTALNLIGVASPESSPSNLVATVTRRESISAPAVRAGHRPVLQRFDAHGQGRQP